jgi:phosphoglycerate dehydrogenase-like enzyme
VRALVTSKSFGREAPDAIALLTDNGIEVVRGSKPTMTPEEIASEVGGVDVLIVGNDRVNAHVLARADRLRLVHMHGTGLDGIDVAAATQAGVLVANAPGANRNAVAELTVALMLVAARSLHSHMESLKAGKWERTAGYELTSKTVGLLGLGSIGRRVVELLAGFAMPVVAHDPWPDAEWAARHQVSLAEDPDAVFAAADFVILTLPLTAQTSGFVDARRLALMKPSAFLVNTARGALVDEAALERAIREKGIAGAALDTFDPEPLAADSPLRDLGIVLTPHLAATSHEAAATVSRVVARNVVDVLVGGRTGCAVNAADVARPAAGGSVTASQEQGDSRP